MVRLGGCTRLARLALCLAQRRGLRIELGQLRVERGIALRLALKVRGAPLLRIQRRQTGTIVLQRRPLRLERLYRLGMCACTLCQRPLALHDLRIDVRKRRLQCRALLGRPAQVIEAAVELRL